MNSQPLTAQTIARNSLRRAGYTRKEVTPLVYDNPADFILNEMYIPETPGIPMTLDPEQADVLRAMSARDASRFCYSTWLFSMPKKSAKCAIIDTMIQMANGTRKRAGDVVPGDKIIAWDGVRCVPAIVSAVQIQPPEPLIKVTTKRGRISVTTAHHPYLVRGDKRPPAFATDTKAGLQDRWVKASDLEPKDGVRVGLDYAESKPCDIEEMWLLGLYVGDGSQGNISCDCPEILERVRKQFVLTYRGQYDYFMKGAQSFLHKHGMLVGSSAHWKNYCNSHNKRVPDTVFSAGREGIAAFLSGYMDSDGSISPYHRKQPCVLWGSVNRELLADCQDLLAAIGFNATLFQHDSKYNGKRVIAWNLAVYGREQVSRLAAVLKLSTPHKREQLEWWAKQTPQHTANVYEIDRVISVEEIEPDVTVAIEVDQYHTHITDGLITHNTTIGAGVALWQAWRLSDGEIYIIGNDLKQADNRMAQAIRYCVEHNPRMRGRVIVTASKYITKLDNGTKIESIPVDPRGEAGMNPTALFWTEAWGAVGSRAELLWTEAALSPTRAGESFKFIESYAGFSGESLLLERVYEAIVKNGTAHPTLPEVYTAGQSIAYWCTRRYLPWQTSESGLAYYRQEALEKTPQEFSRIHENAWSTSDDVFVPSVWWSNCQVEKLPDARPGQGMVLGLDGGLHDDCFAVVLVSKDGDYVDVRECHVWYPPLGGVVDFAEVERELLRIFDQYNVEETAYDETHLAYLVQRLEHRSFWRKFDQGRPRAISDKLLYDLIREQHIRYADQPILTRHILDANRKPEDEAKLRIIKRNERVKVDAAVSLSMAAARISYYNM